MSEESQPLKDKLTELKVAIPSTMLMDNCQYSKGLYMHEDVASAVKYLKEKIVDTLSISLSLTEYLLELIDESFKDVIE